MLTERHTTQSISAVPARAFESAVLVVLIGGMILCSVAFLLLSSLPADRIEHHLRRFSTSGSSHLSVETLESMRRKLAITGAVLLPIAGALGWQFQWLRKHLGGFINEFKQASRALLSSLNSDLRAAGKLRLGTLLVLFVFGLVLRLQFIHQPMRVDEAVTYLSYATKPLPIAISNYGAPNNHLLNTAMVYVSTRVTGHDPWSIRLPALIFGLLLVPLTFLVGLRLYRADVGLLAAALVASSSFLVEYSTNARGYTLQAALFLVAIVLAQELIRTGSPGILVLLSGVIALGFHALPTMMYGFSAILLWLAVSAAVGDRSGSLKSSIRQIILLGVCVVGLTCLLYSPVFLTRGVASVTHNSFVVPIGFRGFFAGLGGMLALAASNFTRDLPVAAAAAMGVLVLVAIAAHAAKDRLARDNVPFIPLMLIACFVCILLQRVLPFDRVWTLIKPVLYIAVAAGLVEIARRVLPTQQQRLTIVVMATIVCFGWGARVWTSGSILRSTQTGLMAEGPAIFEFMISHLQPGDRMVMAHHYRLPILYYFQRAGMDIKSIYNGPEKLQGRAWLVQQEPIAPMDIGMAELREANPRLSEPLLVERIGAANIYLVTALP